MQTHVSFCGNILSANNELSNTLVYRISVDLLPKDSCHNKSYHSLIAVL